MERMPPEDLVFARTILSEVRPAVTAQVFEHIAALEAQANADAYALYGYTVFTGPCVHGRDPWDRCDECGEETAIHALIKVRAKLEKALEDVRKERDDGAHRLKEWEASFNRLSQELVTAQQELARLKPSGQVAEDVRMLRCVLDDEGMGGPGDVPMIALTRLATKAQGYEAAVADNAALVKQLTGYAPYLAAHGFDLRDTAFTLDHPGAALLERMKRLEGAVATASDDALERVAVLADTRAVWVGSDEATALRWLAREIRLMKTCTDGSCAKCRSGEPCR